MHYLVSDLLGFHVTMADCILETCYIIPFIASCSFLLASITFTSCLRMSSSDTITCCNSKYECMSFYFFINNTPNPTPLYILFRGRIGSILQVSKYIYRYSNSLILTRKIHFSSKVISRVSHL